MIVIVILIGVGALSWLSGQQNQQSDGPDILPDDPGLFEPDWCPAVEVISAPGTWESSPDDDPFNPQANPHSFMLSISQPLQEAYDVEDVRVWTLPYTAEFRNIQANHEMSYDDSRNEGIAKVNGELEHIATTCPSTEFILAGFSQGAVILGDIANAIGTGNGAVDQSKILGVALIADGRRVNGVGQNPGVELHGIGAEIALQPVEGLIQVIVPGASMRGEREGGFGELDNRVQQICAPNDTICDAPHGIGNAVERAHELIGANGNHAMYATNPEVIPGTTANQWVVDWSHQLIADNM